MFTVTARDAFGDYHTVKVTVSAIFPTHAEVVDAFDAISLEDYFIVSLVRVEN